MQRLPLINKASATISKAEQHRTISAKSCLLYSVPPLTRSLQSRAINKRSLSRSHCEHHVAASESEPTARIDTHGEKKNRDNKTLAC